MTYQKVVSRSLVLNRQNELIIYFIYFTQCQSVITVIQFPGPVSALLSKMFDVGDRDLPVLTSSNCVLLKAE